MATYIALIDFTEQGVREIGGSPERADAFVKQAAQAGVKVQGLYWTFGAHDGVLIVDAPDDKAASALFLSLARAGNARTKTLRAYDRDEFAEVLAKIE